MNTRSTEIKSTDWIGVDLDGTLAVDDGWQGCEHIGSPIPAMVARVKRWIAAGRTVVILTARPRESYPFIEAYCAEHVGQKLPVTDRKGAGMARLWDDRAVQVLVNSGEPVSATVAKMLDALRHAQRTIQYLTNQRISQPAPDIEMIIARAIAAGDAIAQED